MENIGYRKLLIEYIDTQPVEHIISTEQVAAYMAQKLGLPEENIRQAVNVNMARLEKNGYVVRLAKGAYCRKVKTPFGDYTPSKETVFCNQLLRDSTGVIGYETGLSSLSKLGLVSQMPNRRSIATNLHSKRVPTDVAVEILKPTTVITDDNYRYLQLLDAIGALNQAPVDAQNPAAVIQGLAKAWNLNTDKLILLARKHYAPKTLLRTIDIMLEGRYETTRG